MKKWIVLFCLLIGTCYAVDMDKVRFTDSGAVAILEIDSASYTGQTTFIDTTYFPYSSGINFRFFNEYLFSYGIGDIDTAYIVQMAADSGHIGIALQTSRDGYHWTTVRSDTTMRTRFTYDGDSIPRYKWIDASTFTDDDSAVCCPDVRVAVYLYLDVDSTDTGRDISDTVLMHKTELMGIDIE